VLEDNRAEFETWLVREGGAVPGKAAFEVQLVLGELWEASALPTQPRGQLLPAGEPGRESIARRVPLIVLDDADLEVASSAGAWSAFLHQGHSWDEFTHWQWLTVADKPHAFPF